MNPSISPLTKSMNMLNQQNQPYLGKYDNDECTVQLFYWSNTIDNISVSFFLFIFKFDYVFKSKRYFRNSEIENNILETNKYPTIESWNS